MEQEKWDWDTVSDLVEPRVLHLLPALLLLLVLLLRSQRARQALISGIFNRIQMSLREETLQTPATTAMMTWLRKKIATKEKKP